MDAQTNGRFTCMAGQPFPDAPIPLCWHDERMATPPQAKYSPIDFDFLLYASQRLDGYRAFKAKFF